MFLNAALDGHNAMDCHNQLTSILTVGAHAMAASAEKVLKRKAFLHAKNEKEQEHSATKKRLVLSLSNPTRTLLLPCHKTHQRICGSVFQQQHACIPFAALSDDKSGHV